MCIRGGVYFCAYCMAAFDYGSVQGCAIASARVTDEVIWSRVVFDEFAHEGERFTADVAVLCILGECAMVRGCYDVSAWERTPTGHFWCFWSSHDDPDCPTGRAIAAHADATSWCDPRDGSEDVSTGVVEGIDPGIYEVVRGHCDDPASSSRRP